MRRTLTCQFHSSLGYTELALKTKRQQKLNEKENTSFRPEWHKYEHS